MKHAKALADEATNHKRSAARQGGDGRVREEAQKRAEAAAEVAAHHRHGRRQRRPSRGGDRVGARTSFRSSPPEEEAAAAAAAAAAATGAPVEAGAAAEEAVEAAAAAALLLLPHLAHAPPRCLVAMASRVPSALRVDSRCAAPPTAASTFLTSSRPPRRWVRSRPTKAVPSRPSAWWAPPASPPAEWMDSYTCGSVETRRRQSPIVIRRHLCLWCRRRLR